MESEIESKVAESNLVAGEVWEYSRLITRKDIDEFGRLTGDRGAHHTVSEGKAMAHGLLVAGVVTKLGGDINYVSRVMDLEFLAPVYEGETIKGQIILERVLERPRRKKITMSCKVFKEDGSLAIAGKSKGQVWKD